MSRRKEMSNTRIIIETIKEWMKRHAGELPPGEKKMLAGIVLPEDFAYNYTNCKKQAYKELEREGFILKKVSASRQFVIDYKPPEGIGKKIAEKLWPDPVCDSNEVNNKAPEKKPQESETVIEGGNGKEIAIKHSKDSSQKPHIHIYVNDKMPPANLREIARAILHLSKLEDHKKLTVQIRVTEG